jgi:arsenate reductase
MKEVGVDKSWEQQNIKEEKISPSQLTEMKKLAGTYKALFTRRSMKYRAWNLAEQTLTEKDYRAYILKEYTFLKRPVFIVGQEIFIGNTKANVAALKAALKT